VYSLFFLFFSLSFKSLSTSFLAIKNLSLTVLSSTLFGSFEDSDNFSSWYSNRAMLLKKSCFMNDIKSSKSSCVSHGNPTMKLVLI
jgi:hypothetical protein